MIKQAPASRAKVVFAFAGTAFVAVLPLTILTLGAGSSRSAVADQVVAHGGTALLIAGVVVILLAATHALKTSLRRRPRTVNA